MTQQTLDLQLDKVAFLGINYTEWTNEPPEKVGWFLTFTRVDEDEPLPGLDALHQERRFWNGVRWSKPVIVGSTYDWQADEARTSYSNWATDRIWYRGLDRPHPDGYSLDPTLGTVTFNPPAEDKPQRRQVTAK